MINETPVVFHKDSDYNCHFVIKELTNEFEGQFECIEENTKKYKTFSVSIKKDLIKIDKDDNESIVTISYQIKFIDNARFMETFVDNLTEGSHKIKCNDCDCFIEYEIVEDNLIKYKCLQ